MAGQYIKEISVDEIDKIDIKYLLDIVELDYYKEGLDSDLTKVYAGFLQMWRVREGKSEGIILTKILNYSGTKILEVWLLAGKGLLREHVRLKSDLIEFAKQQDCKEIRLSIDRKGLERLYDKIFQRDSINYKLEI